MKSPLRKELRPYVLAAIIVVVVGLLFASLLYRFDAFLSFASRLFGILSPLVIGLVISLLAAPISNWLEKVFRKWFCRKRNLKKLCRALALALAYLTLIALIAAFFALVLPYLIESIRILVATAPGYVRRLSAELTQWMRDNQWMNDNGISEEYLQGIFGSWESILLRTVEFAGQQVPGIISFSANVSSGVFNFLIGFIVSAYILTSRERFSAQARKILSAYLPGERVELLVFWGRRTNDIFSRFVAGTLLNSLVVGLMCYIFMLIFGWEYSVLISVIVGVTNILPIFGPLVGGITGALILLFINPMSALWFLVMILCVQQFDNNFIALRILGDAIGLSPFWVITTILIGGGFWGVPGMVASVPIFALVYAIARTAVEARLVARGLPPETSEYVVDRVEK